MSQSNVLSVEIPSKWCDDGPETDGVYIGQVRDIPELAGELWYRLFSEEEIKILNSDEKLKLWNQESGEMPKPLTEIFNLTSRSR